MLQIAQRLAAFFAPIAVFSAFFPIGPAPLPAPKPVVASDLPPAAPGLAHSMLAATPALPAALLPGRQAALSAQQGMIHALDNIPQQLAQLPDRPFWIDGAGPQLRGTLVAQTERLDLYVGVSTFSEQEIASMSGHIEQILRDDEAWFGTRMGHRISLGFFRPSAAEIKGVRGLAYTDAARAEVYFAQDESLDRALVVAAHEIAHHLEEERYGTAVQKRADTILHEGLATWITGRRWLELCGASTWKQRGRQLRDAGIPMRLLTAEDYGANNAYEMWTSFVQYLLLQYGWEKFDQLYSSSSGRAPGSADYEGVLGKPLDQLADDWRAWLDS